MTVRTYDSGSDFLAGADLLNGGCLILDLHLPVLGGLELMRILRERKITLPVVFITGGSDVKMRARALDAGAVAFLEKPLTEAPLVSAIRHAIALGNGGAVRDGRESSLC